MSSVQVVRPGDLVRIGPNDKRRVVFDWDFENLNLASLAEVATSTFSVRVIRQNGATILTYDSAVKLSAADASTALGRTVTGDNRATMVRILGTTASPGDVYEFSNLVISNEAIAKQNQQSIKVQIRSG